MAGDKNINIGVGADVSGLKTGMNEAAKIVQDAGTKMQTAAKDATAKTVVASDNGGNLRLVFGGFTTPVVIDIRVWVG